MESPWSHAARGYRGQNDDQRLFRLLDNETGSWIVQIYTWLLHELAGLASLLKHSSVSLRTQKSSHYSKSNLVALQNPS